MRWITRCPECRTVYQLGPEPLEASGGWLQCGHCRHVFDGTGRVLAWPSSPIQASEPERRVDIKDFLRQEDAAALQAVPPAPKEPAQDPLWAVAAGVAEDVRSPADEAMPQRRWLARTLALIAALVLALQMLWFWRDAVGSRWPVLLPALETLCRPVHCHVEPLRMVDAVSLESSRLVRRPVLADEAPAYDLQVSVRNASTVVVAMVSLELTLHDAQGQALLRRVLQPSEWGAPARLAAGQTWEGRVDFELDMPDAVSGYRLVGFYP